MTDEGPNVYRFQFPESHGSSTVYFISLWQPYDMPKKNGSSNRMTIEQIRAATRADVKRILDKPPVSKSPKNRSILA
jgi:hypothetical protein